MLPYESHQIAGAGQQKYEEGGLHAAQVDILIVNCSLFNPTPSLSAMVVNHFGMRPDIKSYNLSGMGCSAGIISIVLARELLQVHMRTLMISVWQFKASIWKQMFLLTRCPQK